MGFATLNPSYDEPPIVPASPS